MIKELFNTRKAADIITEILIFVLVILISTFILRLTWNNSLVKHITVLKKLDTLHLPRRHPWYLKLFKSYNLFTGRADTGREGFHAITPTLGAVDEGVRLSIFLHVINLFTSPSTTHGPVNFPPISRFLPGCCGLEAI